MVEYLEIVEVTETRHAWYVNACLSIGCVLLRPPDRESCSYILGRTALVNQFPDFDQANLDRYSDESDSTKEEGEVGQAHIAADDEELPF